MSKQDVMESKADRIQAAADAIRHVDEEETAEEPTEEPTEDVEADAPAGEVQPEESPAEVSEPEAEAPAPDKSVNAEFAALRRHQKKFEADQRAFEERIGARAKELDEREKRLSPLESEQDPEKFFELVAQRRGLDPDALFERIAHRRINQGEPTAAEAMAEVTRLREELKAREEREKAGRTKSQQQLRARQQQETIDNYVSEALRLPSIPQAAKDFPHLTALTQDQIAGKVREGVQWAMKNSPETKWPELLKAIDEIAGEEHAHSERIRAARAAESLPQSSEVERVPDKPAAPSRTISNQQQAQSSSRSNGDALPSKQERLRRATEALSIRK